MSDRDANAPQLDYAPGRGVTRRRIVRRAVLMVTTIALVIAGWKYGPAMWLRSRLIYWQRQCMNFEAPADAVVYERLPAGSEKPGTEPPFVDWDSPEVAKSPFQQTAWESMPSPPVIVRRGPRCLLRLQQVQVTQIGDNAVFFCHERVSPGGQKRLVVVSLSWMDDFSLGDVFDRAMTSSVCPRIPWYGPLPTSTRSGIAIDHSGPSLPPPETYYAGQPDPADPSHFTIEYEWPDGVHGFVDGWLRDDDSVTLKVRPGPGDIQSAFRRGLHD